MRLAWVALALLAAIIISGCSFHRQYAPGDYTFYLRHDSLTRKYIVHVPQGYSADSSYPLVLVFHGGGGNAGIGKSYFQMDAKADKEGFIVAYPEGSGPTLLGKKFGTWNAGRCCGQAADNNVDDVGFARAVVSSLESKFSVNASRVYATGMSNGALFTYRLACEAADVFAAVAPVSGQDSLDSCAPSRPVPVLHFHGTADPCALYSGGSCGGCYSDLFKKMFGITVSEKHWDCMAVPDYVAEWAGMDGCTNQTKVVYENGSATCIAYQGCSADVELCTVQGAGHTWPGWTSYPDSSCAKDPEGRLCSIMKDTVGPISSDISADDVMWDFFRAHPMG